VAQALRAAFYTVSDEFDVHSLHSYFILAGNADVPVIYQVHRLRDGRSYATRYVTATQKGRAIFVCSFSFAKPDTKNLNLSHQVEMHKVPSPETLPSDLERLENALNSKDITPKFRDHIRQKMEESSPMDYREDYNPGPNSTKYRYFKTRGKLGDDKRTHACVIAYASDSGFIDTTVSANGVPNNGVGMLISLDHSMWFHEAARADEWLLYEMQSPRTNDGRGVVFGKIFTKEGKLVVTTAQEGVVRLTKREQEKHKQSKL
ncbi:HotDog domain-containing protein, partial [Sporodiniella umbellata]